MQLRTLMDTPTLAAIDFARTFYVHGRHILAIIGRKPSSSEIELAQSQATDGTFILRLRYLGPYTDSQDTFYMVCPVYDPGPMRRSLRLLNATGADTFPVEPINCGARRATGSSPTFRLDEAFEEALRQLPPFQKAPPEQPLPLVDILAMGAIYGGFSGFSRLFLRVGSSGDHSPL